MNRIALSLAIFCLTAPGLLRAEEGNTLLVRYALLVGGREAGQAASSAGVLSRDELTKTLIDWDPANIWRRETPGSSVSPDWPIKQSRPSRGSNPTPWGSR